MSNASELELFKKTELLDICDDEGARCLKSWNKAKIIAAILENRKIREKSGVEPTLPREVDGVRYPFEEDPRPEVEVEKQRARRRSPRGSPKKSPRGSPRKNRSPFRRTSPKRTPEKTPKALKQDCRIHPDDCENLTKKEVIAIGKKCGVSTTGTKYDICIRIARAYAEAIESIQPEPITAENPAPEDISICNLPDDCTETYTREELYLLAQDCGCKPEETDSKAILCEKIRAQYDYLLQATAEETPVEVTVVETITPAAPGPAGPSSTPPAPAAAPGPAGPSSTPPAPAAPGPTPAPQGTPPKSDVVPTVAVSSGEVEAQPLGDLTESGLPVAAGQSDPPIQTPIRPRGETGDGVEIRPGASQYDKSADPEQLKKFLSELVSASESSTSITPEVQATIERCLGLPASTA